MFYPYQWTLAHGGARVDLQGQPVGEMTKEQQVYARERLKAIAEKRKQQRQAAATKPIDASKAATPAMDIHPAPAPACIPSRLILTLKRRAGT